MNSLGTRRRRIGFVLLAVLAVVIWRWTAPLGRRAPEYPLFTARRGPLTIDVTESGAIQSRDRVVVRSQVEGRATIVWLIDEGTHVAEGALLVELDAGAFEEQRIDQEIRVENAEAALIQARESLAITRNQGEADIDRARLDLRFADLDLEKYEAGEYPMKLQRAEAAITLAGEELKKAEDDHAWSLKLAAEGYITRSEAISDELAVRRKQLDLKTAEDNLRVLTDYQHGRDLESLRSDVRQKTMALERVERRARADIINSEADLRAKEAAFHQQTSRLTRINAQIANCRIVAPAAGMVVYATTGQRRWQAGQPLAVGQDVSQRQELIHLPATAAMNAEVRIPESALSKIARGMRAIIHVDALPGRTLRGTLTRIAVLPDAGQSWMNPDIKVYNVDVELEDDVPDLRPGMSCRVEIRVKDIEEAVYIPVQAVVRQGDRHLVYVIVNGRPVPQTVRIGLDNNIMIHIVEGLDGGEDVWLAPPLAPTLDRADPPVASGRPAAAVRSETPAGEGRTERPEAADRTAPDRNRRGERRPAAD